MDTCAHRRMQETLTYITHVLRKTEISNRTKDTQRPCDTPFNEADGPRKGVLVWMKASRGNEASAAASAEVISGMIEEVRLQPAVFSLLL